MDQVSRLQDWLREGARHRRARILAVTGGKGGVGKTHIAVGLALAAADLGRSTVLLDGDLGLANVDVLLGLEPTFDLSHVLAGEATLDDALVLAPLGLQVLPGASGVTRLADLSPDDCEVMARELAALQERADLLIVDTAAGIGRDTVDFCVASGEMVVVTTPEPTAIADAYALIKVVAQRDPTVAIHLVANVVRDREEGRQVLSRVESVARRHLGARPRAAGYVLRDEALPEAVRQRRPYFLAEPNGRAARCVRDVAGRLELGCPAARVGAGGLLRRVGALFTP